MSVCTITALQREGWACNAATIEHIPDWAMDPQRCRPESGTYVFPWVW